MMVFDLSDERVIGQVCDHEGLRQVNMYLLEGNAVTNPSIQVSVQLGCGTYESKNTKIVFTADNNSVSAEDVMMNLVTFGTLAIAFKPGFRIFVRLDKVVFSDSTLNMNITYRETE